MASTSTPRGSLELLSILDQRRHYLSELAHTHRVLSRQYHKLAQLEVTKEESHPSSPQRPTRKKARWMGDVTKKAIDGVQRQQVVLEDNLRQCDAAIAVCAPWMLNALRTLHLEELLQPVNVNIQQLRPQQQDYRQPLHERPYMTQNRLDLNRIWIDQSSKTNHNEFSEDEDGDTASTSRITATGFPCKEFLPDRRHSESSIKWIDVLLDGLCNHRRTASLSDLPSC